MENPLIELMESYSNPGSSDFCVHPAFTAEPDSVNDDATFARGLSSSHVSTDTVGAPRSSRFSQAISPFASATWNWWTSNPFGDVPNSFGVPTTVAFGSVPDCVADGFRMPP